MCIDHWKSPSHLPYMVPDPETNAWSHMEEGTGFDLKKCYTDYTNYAILQFPVYYYILHLSLSQVPYMVND